MGTIQVATKFHPKIGTANLPGDPPPKRKRRRSRQATRAASRVLYGIPHEHLNGFPRNGNGNGNGNGGGNGA